MSFIEIAKEKGAEIVGKIGIFGAVTTEAGRAVGMLDNVTTVQVISVAGVILMAIDKSVRLYWDSEQKGSKLSTSLIISAFWLTLISLIIISARI